jgi:hypothetical protein
VAYSERERIGIALSECFVDNETDYDALAADLRGVPLDLLKRIFFRDVAPVCGSNMLTPAPPIWTGFDERWLIDAIRDLNARRERGVIARWRVNLDVCFYRVALDFVWKEVAREIVKRRESAG